MDAAQFRLPVRIQSAPGDPISEVYSAEQALDFLLAWPHHQGRVYEAALKACFAATVDVEAAEKAQQAFRAFARLSGILSRDMMPALPGAFGFRPHLPG